MATCHHHLQLSPSHRTPTRTPTFTAPACLSLPSSSSSPHKGLPKLPLRSRPLTHLPRCSPLRVHATLKETNQRVKDSDASPTPATTSSTSSSSSSSASSPPSVAEEAERITKKWGLEAGLWKALTRKDASVSEDASAAAASSSTSGSGSGSGAGDGDGVTGAKSNTQVAKELLARYGGAYLATSITLAAVSFSICYLLVDGGVDVPALLQSVGLEVNSTGETVGTFALAYAAHKALSPVRFPPTVALTPVVARWFAKEEGSEGEDKK